MFDLQTLYANGVLYAIDLYELMYGRSIFGKSFATNRLYTYKFNKLEEQIKESRRHKKGFNYFGRDYAGMPNIVRIESTNEGYLVTAASGEKFYTNNIMEDSRVSKEVKRKWGVLQMTDECVRIDKVGTRVSGDVTWVVTTIGASRGQKSYKKAKK